MSSLAGTSEEFHSQYPTDESLRIAAQAVRRAQERSLEEQNLFLARLSAAFEALKQAAGASESAGLVAGIQHLQEIAGAQPAGFPITVLCQLIARETQKDGKPRNVEHLLRLLDAEGSRLLARDPCCSPELIDILTMYIAWRDGPTSSHWKYLSAPPWTSRYGLLRDRGPFATGARWRMKLRARLAGLVRALR